MEMHYYNPINIARLNESECMAQCCYSENNGRVEQTGRAKIKRQKKGKERARERASVCADGTITKLKEEADGKTGDGGGDVIPMVIFNVLN